MLRILTLFIFLTAYGTFAQRSLRDSTVNTFLIGLNYKANLTGGDLSERWGFNNHLGLDISNKFKNNVTVTLGGGFIFGNQLKDTTIFDGLYNEFGTITGLSGKPADVLFLMRGATGHASIGYVWNKWGNNLNSGIWVQAGFGYMMHKIRIESLYDVVPQLEGDYRKGYDKLSMGFSTLQFIGYLYQSDWRLIKFYGGFEFIQGFTKNVRTYNFDTGGPEMEARFDLFHGFKVGMVLPIAERTRSQYYYE